MKERKSYKGTLNGNFCICTDKKPKGLKDVEETTFYQADEGKVFVDKHGNEYDCVFLKNGLTIDDYQEIDKPKEEKDEQRNDE